MFGLDNTSGVSVMPPIADKLNTNPLWFTEGGSGAPPSYAGKDWYNAIQAELVNFIIASGLTPSKTDLTQITQAVLKSIQKSPSSFATDTGVANAYVISLTPALTGARGEGQVIRFKVTNPNTGACTVNDGIGVVPLVGLALSALQGGEMVADGDAWIQWHPYVGTGSYVLLFCTGASMQISDASKSHHAVSKGQLDAVTSPATDSVAGISRKATNTEAVAGVSDVGFLTPAGLRAAINAAGSAPVFAPRAWACFKQAGTQTIKASGNILSITDVAVGRTTLTFATAMTDTNYAVAGAPTTQAGSTIGPYSTTPTTAESTLKLTGSCQLGCWDASGVFIDFYDVSVIFTR